MVEGNGLENRRAGNGTVGSNPTPSAIFIRNVTISIMNNSLSTVFRFIIIIFVMLVAVILILGIAGVLTSDTLKTSIVKIAEAAGIILVASGIILVAAKK